MVDHTHVLNASNISRTQTVSLSVTPLGVHEGNTGLTNYIIAVQVLST